MRADGGPVGDPVAGVMASDELQRRALAFPVEGEPGVIDEPARRQVRRTGLSLLGDK